MSMGRKHFGNNLSKVEDPRKIREEAEKKAAEEAKNLASPNRDQKMFDEDRKNFVNVNGAEFRVTPKGRHDEK